MTNKFRKLMKDLTCLVLALSMAGLFVACKKESKTTNEDLGDYHEYLGEDYYDCTISAMVFETPEGETEPGILYRQVLNLEQLTKSCPLTVVFLFYSGMQGDSYGVFACMEEVAEKYHDKVLIVTIDGIAERELTSSYGIKAMPDAIVIRNNLQIARFDGTTRGEWTAIDLADWIIENAVNQ